MKVRIIPCLDIKDGRIVKGVRFTDLVDAGDPVEVAKAYDRAGADELFMLDISASRETREVTLDLVERIAAGINIPLTVGGGIKELEDFEQYLNAGADKVSVGSAAIKTPDLIRKAADRFGSSCITVAIDAKRVKGAGWSVFIDGGRTDTGKDAVKWAKEVEDLGAGEILLTSMDRDGTREGYDIELLSTVAETVSIPVIASGGAGKPRHFLDAIVRGKAGAVLAASLFHFKELEIGDLKDYLRRNGIEI
ncbi:MAG: imidazole glycerol phosphate synthase subunit HisF [Clostridiales bacterium]|jgi:cyclase|nr:imidazole glycerol phosphate synthase subunit HisF [Clostridiales bacterium]